MAETQKVRTSEKIYKVLATRKSRNSEFVIRIAKWDDGPLVLEKRQIVLDEESGLKRVGRCRGFTMLEVRDIVNAKDEIFAVAMEHDERFKTVHSKRDA